MVSLRLKKNAETFRLLDQEETNHNKKDAESELSKKSEQSLQEKYVALVQSCKLAEARADSVTRDNRIKAEEIRVLRIENDHLKRKRSALDIKSSMELEAAEEQLRQRKEKQHNLLGKLQSQDVRTHKARTYLRSQFAAIVIVILVLFHQLESVLELSLGSDIHRDVYTNSSHPPKVHYSHPPILYGHVHMAKTGGTSLNSILANKFDFVCGHKGYSYDAYQDNERAKKKAVNGTVKLAELRSDGEKYSRSRVHPMVMTDIGFENCDYVSHEAHWTFWKKQFGDGRFHSVPMQLHVPCRDPIEHLMSMCNYRHKKIACDAKTNDELFDSVKKCFVLKDRYSHKLQKQFDVKCYNFQHQFTKYMDHMSGILSHRRLESTPNIQRLTNGQRNKEAECIWKNYDVRKKVEKFLVQEVPYYEFCDKCIGSENEIAA